MSNVMGIIGGVLQGGAIIGKGIMAGINKRQGKKELKALEANKPEYYRPEEITELGNIAAMSYMDKEMPGQRLVEENILASTAASINAAKEFGGLSDIAGIQKNQANAFNSLAVAGAENQMANELQYMNTLQLLGQYSDQEFNYNVNMPYQEKKAMAMDKITQGKQGLWNMMGDIGKMGSYMMGGMGGGMMGGGGGSAGNAEAPTFSQSQAKYNEYYGIEQGAVNNFDYTGGDWIPNNVG